MTGLPLKMLLVEEQWHSKQPGMGAGLWTVLTEMAQDAGSYKKKKGSRIPSTIVFPRSA